LRADDIQTLGEIYVGSSIPDIIVGFGMAGLMLGLVLFSVACIYTLMSFTVLYNQREIGIRSALGASPLRLVTGVFRSVLVPVSIGVVLGGVGAQLVAHYWSGLLFGDGRLPLPWILPATEAFLFLLAAISLHGPIRRALRIDPVEALRSE
jgi:ABC-type antimicrobial peptide transport system permease subunit